MKLCNRLLLQARADVDAQDVDGWTPLHAAAHWGQKEACELLVEHYCDMDMKNVVVSFRFFWILAVTFFSINYCSFSVANYC